ncbi:alpha-N-acetylgalactosaminidase-like isoform X1 [Ornithodoros turicata]
MFPRVIVIIFLASNVRCLNNGLAKTPPMGWNTWTRFLCSVDTSQGLDNTISEKLLMEIAQRMYYDGYVAAGYEYIIIDDCWASFVRDSVSKRLVPNKVRFPGGMARLAKFVNQYGIKLGIYADVGSKTCGGYPGSLGYYDLDAKTFADWGIDYVKVDGCNIDPRLMDKVYPQFGKALANSGRNMVYSCEWPFYQELAGIIPNYTYISETCNLWRNYGDMRYGWGPTLGIIHYMAILQDILISVSGPGGWTDPDVLTVGTFGMTRKQYEAQMGFWAVLAAPLIMSADLRNITDEDKAILQNKYVIAVNQDPLGIMGRRVYDEPSGIEIWLRWVVPVSHTGDKSAAILIYNGRGIGGIVTATFALSHLRMHNTDGYVITDLFGDNRTIETALPDQPINVAVEPLSVRMLKATVL